MSKQKKGDRGPRMEQIEMKRQEEQAEMERLRQIRQQEQNELQIKAEVERRVQNEITQRVEQEISRRMPKIEKTIIERVRSEHSDNLSEADNRKHREQVELINELKQNESKHAETINRLEKELGEAKQKLLDAEGKLAEERLQVVEDRRKLEEQKQKFQQEMEQRQKDEQNLILGKKLGSGHKARGKISFAMKMKQ